MKKLYELFQRMRIHQDWFYALILCILAALPRLCYLELAEFKLDEANHYRMAYELTRGSWQWVGSVSSVGISKPPLFVWALALPLAVTRDPRVVTGFLGVLASLSTGGFYLLLRRFWGRKTAFGAALLFAFNPQAVLYARKLFTADLLPPLCVLFLYAGLNFLEASVDAEPVRWGIGKWAALTAFAFALLLLTTFSPLILAPAVFLLFWERRHDLAWRDWGGAFTAFILPFVPYWVTLAPVLLFAARDGLVEQVAAETTIAELPPIADWLLSWLLGTACPEHWISLSGGLAVALLVSSGVGCVWLLWKARTRSWARFFVMWLLGAPLVFLLAPIAHYAHYLIVLCPLLFVLPAIPIDLLDRKSLALGWAGLAGMVGIAIGYVGIWIGMMQAVTLGVEGYGTPLGYWREAAETARMLARQYSAAEVLVLVPGDQPWDEKAAVLDALLGNQPHRVVNGYTTVVYPSHPAIFVIASEVDASLTYPCTQELANGIASPYGDTYHYRLWQPDAENASACVAALMPAEEYWASGTALLGYGVADVQSRELLAPGSSRQFILYWEVRNGPLNEDVHWFNHLEDETGQRWAQFDGVGWPASRWKPQDRILWHFDMTLASEAAPPPYRWRIGQYTYPAMEGIPVVDAAGNPVDSAILLPLP
ncbi:MAG: glycosyltransferase family 39 protein [Anaerolineae bacterium]|nr:glycosyltransferase family 39 protein [Anaerolineae bacterium]